MVITKPRRTTTKPRTTTLEAQITSSVRGETPARRPGMSRPEMLQLQAQNTHSLPRKLSVIWASCELSGQAVSCLGLKLQHFGARPAGPPGVSPRTLLVVLGLESGRSGLGSGRSGLGNGRSGEVHLKKVHLRKPRVSGSQDAIKSEADAQKAYLELLAAAPQPAGPRPSDAGRFRHALRTSV